MDKALNIYTWSLINQSYWGRNLSPQAHKILKSYIELQSLNTTHEVCYHLHGRPTFFLLGTDLTLDRFYTL